VEVDDVSVRLGAVAVLDAVNLSVPAGERLVVLGASGGGKTTLLRVIAGLQAIDAGTVCIDGIDQSATPPERRHVGMVFQDHALFVHLDVAHNIAFGLKLAGWSRDAQRARVGELLDLVGLTDFGARRVDDLSGGERQRVALARALAPSPSVLLLDEPLGALDRARRDDLVRELRSVFDDLEVTAVHVTHDQDEAFALADRVAVLVDGHIAQVAAPAELRATPATAEVAGLVGATTVIDGSVLARWGIRRSGPVLVPPSAVRVHPRDRPSTGAGERGVVDEVVWRGGRQVPLVRVASVVLEAFDGVDDAWTPGDRVTVVLDAASIVDLGSG
jgi:thiamine transport system ATP-binding protein